MRFNLQEISGSRVRLRYTVELHYDLAGPAEFLLNVHAAQTPRQKVVEEIFELSPYQPAAIDVDPAVGNRIAAFGAISGALTVRYAALVDLEHRMDDPADVVAESPSELPVPTLRYIYPSRYCQADLIQQNAWDMFGRLPRGYAQVVAVRDWVRAQLRFQTGVSQSTTTVLDTLRDGAGVCRDFAHTMIAYCRALNYPSRFVTGVDFGADPVLGPPDFHAYVEVFVGGLWYMFDPTGISPVTGLIRIGTGRDAADVSFATIFGPVQTGMPVVTISAVDDVALGFVPPVCTELAVSTAH
ncbi:MAG: transglutaminase family protein [Casimicrobiaceae bacterium]